MRISISTDYGIRILQFLHANKGETHTSLRIAASIGITYPFFIKVANHLKQKGLLKSILGKNGGYVLGRPGHEISVYDVFLATEGDLQITRCLQKERPCENEERRNCGMHTFYCELQERMIATMAGIAIADFVHAKDCPQGKAEQIA